ncbi:hypothetical protein GCM10011506_23430 [Marivirga lumbricoides]|uniref:SGNH hydrolase-type esterase domain-containing protein n=1 Tax=Marivirga lumbricoides TaxID=1046115 RepID=A0ABQ1MD85_9BACT|nr:hypothetical protein GCM10011506_23430 [Marivirga lumbricoides]
MKKIWLIPVLLLSIACSSEKKNSKDNIQATATEKQDAQPSRETPSEQNIIFFGNSLTAGYGVDPSEAFAGLIQERIDSLDYDYNVINAGVSGETTATGLSRVEWVIKRQPVDVFVLELGGNDGLRGINPKETKKNLIAIIEKVRGIHPEVEILLAGMMIPPNMGEDYANEFKKIYAEIAETKNVKLIPFLLKDVGGIADLNLPDGIHPTPAGHKIVAETVWEYLKPLL